MKFKTFQIILIFLLLFTFVSAKTYYADSKITILSDGSSEITGTSDYNSLLLGMTSDLTSKSGSSWSFNFKTTEEFSDYLLTIVFPSGVEIESIKTSGDYRVTNENGALTLIIVGQNEPISVLVNYSLAIQTTHEENPFPLELILLVIVILIIIILFFFFKKRLSKSIDPEEKLTMAALTDRQRDIIKYLKSHKGQATQVELTKELKLPKASMSRNLDSLKRKELIISQRKGLTVLVMLKKKN